MEGSIMGVCVLYPWFAPWFVDFMVWLRMTHVVMNVWWRLWYYNSVLRTGYEAWVFVSFFQAFFHDVGPFNWVASSWWVICSVSVVGFSWNIFSKVFISMRFICLEKEKQRMLSSMRRRTSSFYLLFNCT